MGIFSRKPSVDEPAAPTPAFEQALAQIEPLDMAQFPSANSEEAHTMEQMWISVVSQVGGGQFDAQQVAAISTLADRLVAANPSLSGFVDRLREIAQGEAQAHPSAPWWPSLANNL